MRELNKLARVSTYNGFMKWNKIFQSLNNKFYTRKLDSPGESKMILSNHSRLPPLKNADVLIDLMKHKPCFVKTKIDKNIMNKYRGQIASQCSIGKMSP